MSARRLARLSIVAAVGAAAAASAQGPLAQPNRLRPIAPNPNQVQMMDQSAQNAMQIAGLTRELRQLQIDLKQTRGELAQTQNQLSQAQSQLSQTGNELKQAQVKLNQLAAQPAGGADPQLAQTVATLKGNYAVLADKFAHHTHKYAFETIKYWNRNFVTDGRPITSDETKQMGSYIESQKSVLAETQGPILHNQ